jgi:hypothetical protein
MPQMIHRTLAPSPGTVFYGPDNRMDTVPRP